MSKTHDIAWAAGFFDGEGFVTIQVRGGKYKGHYLRIGINHVAVEPLLEFQRLFGGTLRKQKAEAVIGNRHQRHSWQCGCNTAKEVLSQLLPFLRNKVKVVKLALEFQTTMTESTKKVSDDVVLTRQWYKDEIQRLNKLD